MSASFGPWTGEAAGLARRIAAFVDAALSDAPTEPTAEPSAAPLAEPFDALALDVHRWQRANDPVLAALTEREPTTFAEIPAVPVGLFKDLPVGTVDPNDAPVVFRTSGTTGGGRGEHRLRSTLLYDRGAIGWARKCVPDAPTDVAALLEDPATAPDSSLAHMVALFGDVTWHVKDGVLDRAGLDRRVRDAARPLYVCTTAFALAEWLDSDVPRLPAGSVLMVTGGFKGRVHKLDDVELYDVARAKLGSERVVTEYGMTELSSQLWGTPGSAYRPPPWLRVVAADPSGRPLPAGEHGQLRFYDLCNLDGSLGVETMDGGVVQEGGSVALTGRLASSPARGCSLTVEEAWARRGAGPPGARAAGDTPERR